MNEQQPPRPNFTYGAPIGGAPPPLPPPAPMAPPGYGMAPPAVPVAQPYGTAPGGPPLPSVPGIGPVREFVLRAERVWMPMLLFGVLFSVCCCLGALRLVPVSMQASGVGAAPAATTASASNPLRSAGRIVWLMSAVVSLMAISRALGAPFRVLVHGGGFETESMFGIRSFRWADVREVVSKPSFSIGERELTITARDPMGRTLFTFEAKESAGGPLVQFLQSMLAQPDASRPALLAAPAGMPAPPGFPAFAPPSPPMLPVGAAGGGATIPIGVRISCWTLLVFCGLQLLAAPIALLVLFVLDPMPDSFSELFGVSFSPGQERLLDILEYTPVTFAPLHILANILVMVGAWKVMRLSIPNLARLRRWLAIKLALTALTLCTILTQCIIVGKVVLDQQGNHYPVAQMIGQGMFSNGIQLFVLVVLLACMSLGDVDEFLRRAGGGSALPPHP